MEDIYKYLPKLQEKFEGEIKYDDLTRVIYSTDASAYKVKPKVVAYPKTISDIKNIILAALYNKCSIIPRGAGTSLAGQVVGDGVVVDISKYFNKILEVNKEERWVRVQPGVVLDELNIFLKPDGLFFGPETSTSNRCVIGGMLGNNACGSHSLIYGSTRDHTLEVKAVLSNGTEAVFKSLTKKEFEEKCKGHDIENRIYKNIRDILTNQENQQEIRQEYPHPSIKRRNTGYALDALLETELFADNNEKFNLCKLIAGSEGTLCFITEIKLNLVPLPPNEKAIFCAHFNSLQEAIKANLIALKYHPDAIELMDDKILNLTKGNIEQSKNRYFVKNDPAAILIIEFCRDTRDEIDKIAKNLENDIREAGYGYHFPIIYGKDINKVWSLRKAGLGLLANMAGDAKPVSVIEDTAVRVEDLEGYLDEFNEILKRYDKDCVYHAHIGTGELHLRPVLNLKDEYDVDLFHKIAWDVAHLVKKYKGSLSGEHGDGRLRGEFIPIMLGNNNYELLKSVKNTWDPENVFNPGKIIDTPKMNTNLRYKPGVETRQINTIFDFSKDGGIVRATEKCNGSGDCRKSEIIGGTMCPSYMATKDERHVTRARANALREYLTNSKKINPYDQRELYNILDLCLSCKACKSECPSSVDIAKLKAEFLQHYYDANGVPLRTKLIAHISSINKIGSLFPLVFNFFIKNKRISTIIKKVTGFAQQRTIPLLYKTTLKKWIRKKIKSLNKKISPIKEIILFVDEFSNYNDTQMGIKAIKLLNALNYKITIYNHEVSGRTFLSKGLLRSAQKIANKNVSKLKYLVNNNKPLIGLEPSALLSFRDEYPELVSDILKDDAAQLACNCYLIDEFLVQEFENGRFSAELFIKDENHIKLHGHCQQKAIASTFPTKKLLSIPKNYTVEEIPSGCCGMAGSFGYEKEHYELSIKVGELVLFPEVRKASEDIIIAAPGTSCRHQIKDGTGREAFHPIEVLYDALIHKG